MIASSYAAIIDCMYESNPLQCYPFTLYDVKEVNVEITVNNPAFIPYVDNITQRLAYNDPFGEVLQFPRRLFDIFINLTDFQISKISSTELGTDSFYNCQNLKAIDILESTIKHIAARFASTCSKVAYFSANNCSIETIDENAFEGLDLVGLRMDDNRITCLPPKLFQHNLNINSIYLNNNQLTALHSKIFSGLRNLHYVGLLDNQIGYIPNFDLNSTSIEVDGLFLIHFNPIVAIDPSLITAVSAARSTITTPLALFMSGTSESITPCFETTFVDTESLQINLATIWFGMTDNFPLQNALYENSTTCYSAYTAEMASDSLITCNPELFTTTSTSTLPPTTPSDIIIPSDQCATDKICRFYLDWNNQYTCVIDGAEGTVTSITGNHYLTYTNADVKRAYFINSHLSLIPKILFQTFPNLKFLHTANSGMTVINDQTFNECGVLELWDASDNDISRVDETSLRNCTNLRIIDLTGNPIDFVSQGLYQLDPALERIHLTRLDDWTLA